MKRLGPVSVGGRSPVRIMGILNVSPESFYGGSVRTSRRGIMGAARRMEEEGADIIDVGAMSTAPYLRTMIPEDVESARMAGAVRIIREATNLPVSADTCRAGVARAALECGAEIINDVTGLKYDGKMAGVIRHFRPSLVLCAYDKRPGPGSVAHTRRLLGESVALASRAGAPTDEIVLDPAIGFFRRRGTGRIFTRTGTDRIGRDLDVLGSLKDIGRGLPVIVSVSRKSFIGRILGVGDPGRRLSGSLACEALSVMAGAAVIRTHNVYESRRVAEIARGPPHADKSL